MTRLKLAAAAAVAVAVADTASAQMFFAPSSGRDRGQSRGYRTVSPAYNGYARPGVTYYSQDMTYSTPMGYGQPTTGYGQSTMGYAVPTTGYTTPMAGGVVYGTPTTGVVQTSGVMAGTPYTGTVQAGGYYPAPTQGVVTSGGFAVPQQMMAGGVVQTGAASSQVVTTQVLAPDGSNVTLSGTPSDRTQGVRPFTSPPLDPNTTYVYRAKATWTENGQTMTRQKNVDVRAGQQVTIDLTKPDADSTTDDQKTTKQPD